MTCYPLADHHLVTALLRQPPRLWSAKLRQQFTRYHLTSQFLPSPRHQRVVAITMRSLNLSRLAKASEGSYFKSQQATQASALRKTLTPEQLTTLRHRARPQPSVDTLSEISAQSAYKRLDPPTSPHISPRPPLVSRISSATEFTRNASTDPPIMRALGSGRLALYQQYRQRAPKVRSLPGGEKYAEGAILGLTSFSIATAFVASFGLVIGAAVYLNPKVLDHVRDRTRRVARRMDVTIGQRMRDRVEAIKQSGPVVGDERREWLGGLLRTAVGARDREEQRKKRAQQDDNG